MSRTIVTVDQVKELVRVGQTIRAAGEFLTNGHWAVRASRCAVPLTALTDADWIGKRLGKRVEVLAEVADGTRFLEKTAPANRRAFKRTELACYGKLGEAMFICFANAATGRRAWFREDYVAALGLDVLYGDAIDSAFVDAGDGLTWDMLIMPGRGPKADAGLLVPEQPPKAAKGRP